MSDFELLNIQPQAGSTYQMFSRLSYKAWYAIAEFVDNSTASFFQRKRIMNFYHIQKIYVKVNYDDKKHVLTIEDNAYGMEIEDFRRAILLNAKPENTSGRNEFGMGLKTAASWFGSKWEVTSTEIDSNNRYSVVVDIEKLAVENSNDVEIIRTDAPRMEHGTLIRISKIPLERYISGGRLIGKIKDILSSMYRRDIKSGEVDIYYNDELLSFQDYPILKFREREWEKNLDFLFNFENQDYHVTGKVGIMAKGSFPRAGFALFRRNRVVIGGSDQNYKPYEIFGQDQSQISLKLFGELDMDDFPVNQAKDGFIWDNGLEDEFIYNLKKAIGDFLTIAAMSIKERVAQESLSNDSSKKVEEEVQDAYKDKILDCDYEEEKRNTKEPTSDADQFEQEMLEDNENVESKVIIDHVRKYHVNLNPTKSIDFEVLWKIGNNDNWFEYDKDNNRIVININHEFFKPYSENSEFKVVLEKFVVAFVSSELLAQYNSENDDGLVLSSAIRNNMNRILKKLSNN